MDFQPNINRDVEWRKGWHDLAEAYVKIKVPGVTSVIGDMIPDPGIEEWIKAVGKEAADKITQAAGWRGTAMHLFIENWLIEMKKSGDPSAALRFTQTESPPFLLKEEEVPQFKVDEGRKLFYNFIESEPASQYTKLIGTETSIYSPILFYRGKIDWLYEQQLYGLSVSDFKTTSKPIEPKSRKEEGYKHQIGAYALAVDHMMLKKDPTSTKKVNYASIIAVHTKSSLVQNIALFDDELQEYKDRFETIVRGYHNKHGQSFLL